MQISVVLDSGKCIHATLALQHGYCLYGDKHLHLQPGAVIHLAGTNAEALIGIPAQHQVVSATQVLKSRIYQLQPVSA